MAYHGAGPRRAPRDVRPLFLGPHPGSCLTWPSKLLQPASLRQGSSRRSIHQPGVVARRRGRGRRRRAPCTTSGCRSTAPTTRPTASSSPTARLGGLVTRFLQGAEADDHRRRGSCTRSSATAAAASPTRSRPAWSRSPMRSTWRRDGPGCRSRRARKRNPRSISAAAVDGVRIEAGKEQRPVRLRDPARRLGRDLPGRRPAGDKDFTTRPLEGRVEVVAEMRGEDSGRTLLAPVACGSAEPPLERLLPHDARPTAGDPGPARRRSPAGRRRRSRRSRRRMIVLSVVSPARPVPFSANATGAATSSIVSAASRAARTRIPAARVKFTRSDAATRRKTPR